MMSGSGRVGGGNNKCLVCQKDLESKSSSDAFGDTKISVRSLYSFYDIGLNDVTNNNVPMAGGDLVVERIASNICDTCAFMTNAFRSKYTEIEQALNFMKRCIRTLAIGNNNDATPQQDANAVLFTRLMELKAECEPKQLNGRSNERADLSSVQEKKSDDVQVQVDPVAENREDAQQVQADGVREAQAACGAQEHGLESGHGQDDAIHNASENNRLAMSNANTSETAGEGEGERSPSVLSTVVDKPTPRDPQARSGAEAAVETASGSANSDNNDRGQENNGNIINIIIKVENTPGQGPSIRGAQSGDGEGDDMDDAQTVALNHTGNRDQDRLISGCESEAGPSSRPSQLLSSVNGEAAAEPPVLDEVVEVEVPIRVTQHTRQHQNVESDFEKKRKLYKTNCRKPPYTCAFLIKKAIRESPNKQLSRNDIFAWFRENFRCYQNEKTRNNIGTVLSTKSCFVRVNVGKKEGVWRVSDKEFYKPQTRWSRKRHTTTTTGPERQDASAMISISEVKVETAMNQDEPNEATSRNDEGHPLNLPESGTIQGSAGGRGPGRTGRRNSGSRRRASGTRLKCDYCTFSFQTKIILKKHLMRVHTVQHFSNQFGPETTRYDVNQAVRQICSENTTIAARKTGTFHCSLCGRDVRGDTKKDHILKSHLATLVSRLEAERRDLPAAGNFDVDMESS